MALPCPTRYSKDTKNIFYLECAHKTFEPISQNFDHVKDEYLEYITKINDPILRHISLYFIQYYIDGYYYFKDSINQYKDAACDYLRHWLQAKKDLFTYGDNCITKKNLWDDKITKLLDMLKSKYTIPDNRSNKAWCDHFTLTLKSTYPVALSSLNCNESISQETSSATCPHPPVQTRNPCPPCPVIPPDTVTYSDTVAQSETVTQSETVPPHEVDRTKNLAVTSGFTAVGTLGTLFFLYRFTPMASWFRRPGMSNIGTGLYMDQGGADSFLRMPHDGGNNIFYQSALE